MVAKCNLCPFTCCEAQLQESKQISVKEHFVEYVLPSIEGHIAFHGQGTPWQWEAGMLQLDRHLTGLNLTGGFYAFRETFRDLRWIVGRNVSLMNKVRYQLYGVIPLSVTIAEPGRELHRELHDMICGVRPWPKMLDNVRFERQCDIVARVESTGLIEIEEAEL